MRTLLKFLVLRVLGWRMAAFLALLGAAKSARSSARRTAARR